MWLRENELQVNSTGVWVRTRDDHVTMWRSRLTEVLKLYGYQLVRSMPLKDSYHLSFEKGDESLTVNTFRDGHIQLSTTEVPTMIDTIIPHLETRLGVKFDGTWLAPDLRPTETPFHPDYVIARNSLVSPPPLPPTQRRKSLTDQTNYHDQTSYHTRTTDALVSPQMRRKGVVEEALEAVAAVRARRKSSGHIHEDYELRYAHAKSRARDIKSHYLKIEGDLEAARKRLNSTQDELSAVKKELVHLSEDLSDFQEKRVRAYRKMRHEVGQVGQVGQGQDEWEYDFNKYLKRSASFR